MEKRKMNKDEVKVTVHEVGEKILYGAKVAAKYSAQFLGFLSENIAKALKWVDQQIDVEKKAKS